jgi:hypothetical protein
VDKVVLNPPLEDRLFGKPVAPAGPGGHPAARGVTSANAYPPEPAAASQ